MTKKKWGTTALILFIESIARIDVANLKIIYWDAVSMYVSIFLCRPHTW